MTSPFEDPPGRDALDLGRIAPDPARLAGGWTPRFVAGPDRVEEVVQLYRELDLEVAADPVAPERLQDQCRDCRVALLRFRYVYTRPRAPRPRGPAPATPEEDPCETP